MSKVFNFFVVTGSLSPNITFLGEKLGPVAWNKKILVLYKENIKNAYKKRKNWYFEKQKNAFLSRFLRIIQPEN